MPSTADVILAMVAQIYEVFSEDKSDLIEKHTRRSENFFGWRTRLLSG